MIGKGELIGGLYVLQQFSHATSDAISQVNLVNNVSTERWHARLGHLSNKVLHSLSHTLSLANPVVNDCTVCPLAKLRRLSFVSNNNLTNAPFDLIHCDVWGPYYVPTYNGKKYYLTIVDDHTRFTWTYLLANKNEATSFIISFFQLIETQFGKVIKQLRSDNAKELALTNFLKEKGVLHQFSCAYRPEQNAVVERKHQHLLNVARALYFQSKVPISLWGECVATATFLLNRIPSPLLKSKTPYEMLFGKPLIITL